MMCWSGGIFGSTHVTPKHCRQRQNFSSIRSLGSLRQPMPCCRDLAGWTSYHTMSMRMYDLVPGGAALRGVCSEIISRRNARRCESGRFACPFGPTNFIDDEMIDHQVQT